MVWSLIVHKKVLETPQLLFKHFPSGLSLCILYFLFHKVKDTSAIPHQAFSILYILYPFSFVFINALITST